MKSSLKTTYLLLLFVMMAWGFNVSAISVLVNEIEPVLLTSIRVFMAGVVVLIITRIFKVFRIQNKAEMKVILYITNYNVFIYHFFLAIGLRSTYVIHARTILWF